MVSGAAEAAAAGLAVGAAAGALVVALVEVARAASSQGSLRSRSAGPRVRGSVIGSSPPR